MIKVDEINESVQGSIISVSPDSTEELYIKSSYLVWNFPLNLPKFLHHQYMTLFYIVP